MRTETVADSTSPPVWLQLTLASSCQQPGPGDQQLFPSGCPLGPTAGWAPHSKKKSWSILAKSTETQLRGLQEESRAETQSYFALIKDVFNTLLRPPWPLYVSDETESSAVGLKNIYLFVTKAENTDLEA